MLKSQPAKEWIAVVTTIKLGAVRVLGPATSCFNLCGDGLIFYGHRRLDEGEGGFCASNESSFLTSPFPVGGIRTHRFSVIIHS